MSLARTISLGLLICFCFAACDDSVGTVEVFLIKSPLVAEDPLDMSLVSHLRIRVSGANMNPVEQTFDFQPGSSSKLPPIPAGDRRIITVEGLAGADGYVISRGRSLPFTVNEGNQEIDLFIGRVGRFSIAPGYGLTQARFGHVALLTKGGDLLVAGGAAGGTMISPLDLLTSIERYDPTSGNTSFFDCGPSSGGMCLQSARAFAAAARVTGGISIYGGRDDYGLLGTVDFIDLQGQTSTQSELLSAARSHAAVFSLNETRVIAGGIDQTGGPTAMAEIVRANGSVVQLAMPAPRQGLAGAAAANIGLLYGGLDPAGQPSSAFITFDPNKNTFDIHSSESEARAFVDAVTLSDGRVILIGGQNEAGTASASVDLFDPIRMLLCPIGSLNQARWHGASIRLPDGRVMVMGGLLSNDPPEPTPSVEILDPRFVKLGATCAQTSGALTITATQSMRIRRYLLSAELLPNGMVAVVGGIDQHGAAIKQIEIFIPE